MSFVSQSEGSPGGNRIIFVVGPPASGKTTFCDALERHLTTAGLNVARVSDGEILLRLWGNRADMQSNGRIVLCDSDRRHLYQQVAAEVAGMCDDCVITEMATNDAKTALSGYSAKLLDRAWLVEMRTTLELALARNSARGETNPTKPNAVIPEEYILTFFQGGQQALISAPFLQTTVVTNHGGDLDDLSRAAKQLCSQVLRM